MNPDRKDLYLLALAGHLRRTWDLRAPLEHLDLSAKRLTAEHEGAVMAEYGPQALLNYYLLPEFRDLDK